MLKKNGVLRAKGIRLRLKTGEERFIKKTVSRKNILFFYTVKKFPQIIENTREIIENMSEIIQNISDIFFAIYTLADFQVLAG